MDPTADKTDFEGPGDSGLSFRRRLLVPLSLLVAAPVWEEAAAFVFLITDDPRSLTNLLTVMLVLAMEIPIVLYLARKSAGLSLAEVFAPRKAHFHVLARWIWVPAWIGGLGFVQQVYHGYQLGTPGLGPFLTFNFVIYGFARPIQEEVIYRHLLFPALGRCSRSLAYLLTTALFVLSHSPSYARLLLHAETGLTYYDVITSAAFSLAACRIYETTRSLFPCILLHSVTNLLPWVGALVGAILGVGQAI